IGEPTGRGADVDADPAADGRTELLERVRELFAAAADVRRPAADLDLRGRLDERARLVHPAAVDEDLACHDATGRLLASREERFLYEEFVESHPGRHAVIIGEPLPAAGIERSARGPPRTLRRGRTRRP